MLPTQESPGGGAKYREEQFRQVFEEAPVGDDHPGRTAALYPCQSSVLQLSRIQRSRVDRAGSTSCARTLTTFRRTWRSTNEFYEGKRTGYRLDKRYIRKDGQGSCGSRSTRRRIGSPLNSQRWCWRIIEDLTERKREEEALRATQGKAATGPPRFQDRDVGLEHQHERGVLSREWKSQLGYENRTWRTPLKRGKRSYTPTITRRPWPMSEPHLKTPVGNY